MAIEKPWWSPGDDWESYHEEQDGSLRLDCWKRDDGSLIQEISHEMIEDDNDDRLFIIDFYTPMGGHVRFNDVSPAVDAIDGIIELMDAHRVVSVEVYRNNELDEIPDPTLAWPHAYINDLRTNLEVITDKYDNIGLMPLNPMNDEHSEAIVSHAFHSVVCMNHAQQALHVLKTLDAMLNGEHLLFDHFDAGHHHDDGDAVLDDIE